MLRGTALALLSVLLLGAEEAPDPYAFLGPADMALSAGELSAAGTLAPQISFIEWGSAASKSDLMKGDTLIGLDGHRIWSKAEMRLVLSMGRERPMDPIPVLVLHKGKPLALTLRPSRTRDPGFFVEDRHDGLDLVLTAAGLRHDPVKDPLVWRAWRQLPARIAADLLIWFQAETRQPADLAWLKPLETLLSGLCQQDYRAAAAVPAIKAPTPALQNYADLLRRIAAQCKDGERVPDPGQLGLSRSACAILYPWPLLVPPPAGDLDPAMAAALGEAGILPARFRPEGAEWCLRVPGAVVMSDGVEGYVSGLRMAALDPLNHGGWPHRFDAVSRTPDRERFLREIDAYLAQHPKDPWWRLSRNVLGWIDVLLGKDRSYKGFDAGLATAVDACLALGERSPFLAWKGIAMCEHAADPLPVEGLRRNFRAAYQRREVQLTLHPSPILAFLRKHSPGTVFWDPDRWEGGCLALASAEIYDALGPRREIEVIEDEIAKIVPSDGVAKRKALLDEILRDFGHMLDRKDLLRMVIPLVGEGQACGVFSDMLPMLFAKTRHYRSPYSFSYLIFDALRPVDRDLDLPAIATALAKIPWDDAAQAGAAVEAVRLRLGHPSGMLVIADACAAHGQAKLAEDLRQRVIRLHREVRDQVKAWNSEASVIAQADAEAVIILSSSMATAGKADEIAKASLKKRPKQVAWNSGNLAYAQALLALKKPKDCLDQLAASCAGKASSDPLLCHDGVLRKEPEMRAWLIAQLLAAGPLDAAGKEQLLKAANADLLPPEALTLLGSSPGELGGKPSEAPPAPRRDPGNDF